MTSSRTACVVGAGPAGLVTAKVFGDDGFDVTVLEKYDEVGGTWSSYRRYANLNHQLDRGIFEFSDMPNDEGYEDAESVQSYLEEYADRFGIRDRIEFETEVTSLSEQAEGWELETNGGPQAGGNRRHFDYVAVCSGMHHLPKIPDFPGLDEFDGTLLHSSEVDDTEILEDERIVVVGGGKSAHDLSIESAEAGEETTMVFRRANWMVPKKLLGGTLPHRFILYTRFGESLLPQYYNEDCVRLIDRIPEPVKDAMWKVVNRDIIRSGGLHSVDDDLVPETELRYHITHAGVMPEEFEAYVEAGRINPIKATVDRVRSNGVELSTGEFIDADVIVLATGFRKDVPFLEDADLKTDDGNFYLYRSIVPPMLDNIGIIGTRQTFNNLLSMEVSAHWLSAYFQNELEEMPTTDEMCETIDERLEWQESVLPNTEGFDFGPYDIHCVDELLQDMGVPTKRTGNPISEYLIPGARGRRYADLDTERSGPKAVAEDRSVLGSITSVFGLF